MRRFFALAAGLAAVGVLTAAATAATPTPKPFPATKVGPIFLAAQTVNTSGAMSSAFAPGATVVFRAYALDTKTDKPLGAKSAKYFYATIPNQPNVKLTYNPSAPGATAHMPWTGKWTVPATYPSGVVNFKLLVKTTSKRMGSFVQMPVATAQLNISPTAAVPYGPGPTTNPPANSTAATLGLYVDSVAGTAPAGAPVRPVSCTQTNVYKRGERMVVRAWGFDLKTGDTLSNDNVNTATYTIPGQAPITLTYGAHGATGSQVYFWSNFFIFPATFPLGDVTVHVTFTTDSGTGSVDYPITVVP